jgi:hypothetical protein
MKDLATLELPLSPEDCGLLIHHIREILLKETVHLEEICADCNGYRSAAITDETKGIITGACFTEGYDSQ